MKIEKRLTEVRTDLENVTSQLRVYDNLVSYSTIYLHLDEVKEYTVVEEPETFWDRLSNGFTTSIKSLGSFLTELFFLLMVALPWLLPIAAIITVIVLFSRRRKKNTPPPAPPQIMQNKE